MADWIRFDKHLLAKNIRDQFLEAAMNWVPDTALLSNDPPKKESANRNARWNVNFFIVTTSDLIGQDSKTAEKLWLKVHFVWFF